jgi:FAD:protein FMN transferase
MRFKQRLNKFKRPISILIMMCISVLFFVASCSEKSSDTSLKVGRILMGTLVEVTAVGAPNQLKEFAEAALTEIKRVEDLTSFHKESDLKQINDNAGRSPTKVNPELISLIQRSLDIAEQTDGAFDPTIGPLSRLWNFSGPEGPRLPNESEIAEARKKVNWRKLEISPDKHEVFLPEEGMALDLGGIAKGYALNRAAEILKSKGVKGALLNAGGDIVTFGSKSDGRPWKVGIQDPRDKSRIEAAVDMEAGAVFTSGDYERFLEKDGKRYHHVLDPSTGYPADGFESVTIVAPDGFGADGFSAAVLVLGPDKAKLFLEKYPNISCLVVDQSGKIGVYPEGSSVFELRN